MSGPQKLTNLKIFFLVFFHETDVNSLAGKSQCAIRETRNGARVRKPGELFSMIFCSLYSNWFRQVSAFYLEIVLYEICTFCLEIALYETFFESIFLFSLQLFHIPCFLQEVYVNFDCDLHSANVLEDLCKSLSKVFQYLIILQVA